MKPPAPRDWLRLFRAQTAPATFILLVASYLIGGGHDYGVAAILLGLGVVSHFASFGHNTVLDYRYDLEDPSKAHHPLNMGLIQIPQGVRVVNILQALAAAGLAYLAWGDWIAMACLVGFVVCGHWYNDGYSKVSRLAWLPISAAWAFLALYAMQVGGSINPWFAAYVFATTWFQIDWEGRLKDLETPEPSWMKDLGAKIHAGRFLPGWSQAYSIALQAVQLAIAAYILYAAWTPWKLLPFIILASIMTLTGTQLTSPRPYERAHDLARMGKHEVSATFLGVYLLVDPMLATILCALGLAWFVAMNRALWGTTFAPRV